MQEFPLLKAKYLIPVQFLVKNGVRLFNKKQYQDAVDNFQKALEHCADIDSENMLTILPVIQDNMATALDMLIYQLWIDDEISSAEAFEKLQSIENELTSDDLKKSIKKHLQQISREQVWFTQLTDVNFNEDDLFYNKDESEKLDQKKLSTQEFNEKFLQEVFKLNGEVQKHCYTGNLEDATYEWKFLMKIITLKDINPENSYTPLHSSTLLLVNKWTEVGQIEEALDVIKLAKKRFPELHQNFGDLENPTLNKSYKVYEMKEDRQSKTDTSQLTVESESEKPKFDNRLIKFGILSVIAFIAITIEILSK